MKLASFDIFDTTLIRRCGQPENIFYLLAQTLYPDNEARQDDFFLWRCGAEQQAMSAKKSKNVTLADIYDSPEVDSFTEYTVENLLVRERDVERDNLMPNPAVRQLIAEKRAEGFCICFISDMYLDSVFLSEILEENKCIEAGDRVFVSCEAKARKSDGELFAYVRNELSPEEWIHYGDNRHSDVKIPKKYGIKSAWVDTSFSGVEKRMIAKAKEFRNRTDMSVLAGYARAGRIRANNDSFAVIASDYVAPAYIPYVRFVLEQAKRSGIEQLYFLSRDSYVLLKAAQKMNKEYTGIELKYLFVSRKSLMLPYLADITKDDFLEVVDRKTVMRKKVSSLLSLLGVDDKMLKEHNISFSYQKITNRTQEVDFLDKIFDSPLTLTLKRISADKHALLMEYFAQEGLLSGKKSAMVDVGWLGTSRLMINSILRRGGYNGVLFYYLGVRQDVLHSQYGEYLSYFHAGQLSTEATSLIENYFSASPYPTTVGYKRDDNRRIVPLFPDGKQYEETEITEANVCALEYLSEALTQISVDETLLFAWSSLALDCFSTLKDKVDLTAFLSSNDFDDTSFVRRLSAKELFEIVCLGKHITAFDKASMQATLGFAAMRFLWPLRNFTVKLRRKIYLYKQRRVLG